MKTMVAWESRGRGRSWASFRRPPRTRRSVRHSFLQALVEHGLQVEPGLLGVIDGAKGLRTAVKTVLGAQALVKRCQWHKRENISRRLGRRPAVDGCSRLYERSTYAGPGRPWTSCVRSYGAQRLGRRQSGGRPRGDVDPPSPGALSDLGVSLKTTNGVESLNAQLGQLTDKVSHWPTADQKPRWVASVLVLIERACGESKATAICRCCAWPCRLRSGGLS